MRFRRLTKNELEKLEDDFITFLASQTITAKEWDLLKTNNPEKVHELLDVFSDIVLEKVFDKMQYLQHRTNDTIRVFKCDADVITMTGLHVNDSQVDLTRTEDLQRLTDPSNIRGMVNVFQMEKKYRSNKPDEIFQMMHQNGCQVASEDMFNSLVDMYKLTQG